MDFGEDVLVGSNVTILSGKRQHGFERTDLPINLQPGEYQRVRIGDDCWLGNGSIIMAPIASHSIVAAGAVVAGPNSDGTVIAGNPATVVRNRFEIQGEQ